MKKTLKKKKISKKSKIKGKIQITDVMTEDDTFEYELSEIYEENITGRARRKLRVLLPLEFDDESLLLQKTLREEIRFYYGSPDGEETDEW